MLSKLFKPKKSLQDNNQSDNINPSTLISQKSSNPLRRQRPRLLSFTKWFTNFTRCFGETASLMADNQKKSCQLGPQSEKYKGRKTLILDLDETLIHSTLEYTRSPDFVLPIKIKGVTHLINIHKRPQVEEFLSRVCRLFEVVIFTASLEEYALPLIKKIDKKNEVACFLYREHCTVFDGAFVKDLSKIGRNVKDIILIDNSANSFMFQPENAYHIKDFFEDKNDRELSKLLPLLEYLSRVDDVRPISAHQKVFESHYNFKEKPLNTLPENKETEVLELPPITIETRPSERNSTKRFMRADTDTGLLRCDTEYLQTNEEREAIRIIQSLSVKQEAMRMKAKALSRNPLSLARNFRNSSTSAGSTAENEDGSVGCPEVFLEEPSEYPQNFELETEAQDATNKMKFDPTAKIFEFPDLRKDRYTNFECEDGNFEEDKTPGINIESLEAPRLREHKPTSPRNRQSLHNYLAKGKVNAEIY